MWEQCDPGTGKDAPGIVHRQDAVAENPGYDVDGGVELRGDRTLR